MMIGGVLLSILGILAFIFTFVSSPVPSLFTVSASLLVIAVGGVIWLVGAIRHLEFLSNSH